MSRSTPRPASGGGTSAPADAPEATLCLRVTLVDVEPTVWREILVPVDLTFAQLHTVLQTAMGWEDCHLHEFSVGDLSIGPPAPKDFFAGDRHLLDERRARLGDVLDGRRKFRYWYDFGDDWWHEISIRKCPAGEAGGLRLLAGAGACPPEDCGGPYGYAELLRALADPKHPQHRELREWAGDFDPQQFDFGATAARVVKAIRRTKRRE
jgi:hypothetical protein